MKVIIIILGVLLVNSVFSGVMLFLVLKNKKLSENKVMNYDTLANTLLFSTNDSKEEFLRKLSVSNVNDYPYYTFYKDEMKVVFCLRGSRIPCDLILKEENGKCYVRLSRTRLLGRISPYYINELMEKKFHATLLPYEDYKSFV